MLPLPGRHGQFHGSDLRRKGLAVFLNSRGEITAYGSSGQLHWQVFTPCNWRAQRGRDVDDTMDQDGVGGMKTPPTLFPLPLRVHAIPTIILAGKEYALVPCSLHARNVC
jgi:hypothetical protein